MPEKQDVTCTRKNEATGKWSYINVTELREGDNVWLNSAEVIHPETIAWLNKNATEGRMAKYYEVWVDGKKTTLATLEAAKDKVAFEHFKGGNAALRMFVGNLDDRERPSSLTDEQLEDLKKALKA